MELFGEQELGGAKSPIGDWRVVNIDWRLESTPLANPEGAAALGGVPSTEKPSEGQPAN